MKKHVSENQKIPKEFLYHHHTYSNHFTSLFICYGDLVAVIIGLNINYFILVFVLFDVCQI